MTQTEGVSMTFESKAPAKQMNGADTGRRDQEELSPTSTPPSGQDETSGGSVLAMGSTDSAGNAHDGGPSCGLVSSLFPSSCRGRAEAFARSLHRRLTSLGGENGSNDDFDLNKPNETSWLHSTTIKNGTNSSNNVKLVLDHQPRHSPESDLFFDLEGELEENGIGSPAEEASAAELAHLLVNHQSLKLNHHDTCRCTTTGARPPGTSQDSGSDGVYSSPMTGNNTPENEESEVYFDPLSSDGDKKKDTFFDPVNSSENEGQSTLSNGSEPEMIRVLRRKLEKTKNQNVNTEEETSDSSCSLQKDEIEISRLRTNHVESTDESSNGRSSIDTTSHDSLWSTFDDSTLSENSVKNDALCNIQNRVPKSHSDSELPGMVDVDDIRLARRIEVLKEDVDEVDFAGSTSKLNNSLKDVHNFCLPNGLDHVAKEKDDDDDDDNNESENDKVTSIQETSDTDTDHSTYNSTFNIPGSLTSECVLEIKVEEPIQTVEYDAQLLISDESTINNSTDESEVPERFEKTPDSDIQDENSGADLHLSSEDNAEEEEEEQNQRPPRVRRCSSLKTGKTPPGTPGRKKIVRFADVLGLDLADVRTFLDEIPKIPNSAYSDLIYDDVFHKESSPINCGIQTWSARYLDNNGTNKLDRTLVPLFQQPGGLPNFLDFVRDRRVCLENVLVSDPVTLCIKGTVRVCNFDFHKSVHIRYTLNSWKTYSDLQATYSPNSCDGFSDKFTFTLYCHTLRVGQRLEFAVRFQCKGNQYWDNNLGANYCFQCLPSSPAVGFIPITAPENAHDWTPMFY